MGKVYLGKEKMRGGHTFGRRLGHYEHVMNNLWFSEERFSAHLATNFLDPELLQYRVPVLYFFPADWWF